MSCLLWACSLSRSAQHCENTGPSVAESWGCYVWGTSIHPTAADGLETLAPWSMIGSTAPACAYGTGRRFAAGDLSVRRVPRIFTWLQASPRWRVEGWHEKYGVDLTHGETTFICYSIERRCLNCWGETRGAQHVQISWAQLCCRRSAVFFSVDSGVLSLLD